MIRKSRRICNVAQVLFNVAKPPPNFAKLEKSVVKCRLIGIDDVKNTCKTSVFLGSSGTEPSIAAYFFK